MQLRSRRTAGPMLLAVMLTATLALASGCGGDPCADLQKLSDQVKNPEGMSEQELSDLLDKVAELGGQCLNQEISDAGLE